MFSMSNTTLELLTQLAVNKLSKDIPKLTTLHCQAFLAFLAILWVFLKQQKVTQIEPFLHFLFQFCIKSKEYQKLSVYFNFSIAVTIYRQTNGIQQYNLYFYSL